MCIDRQGAATPPAVPRAGQTAGAGGEQASLIGDHHHHHDTYCPSSSSTAAAAAVAKKETAAAASTTTTGVPAQPQACRTSISAAAAAAAAQNVLDSPVVSKWFSAVAADLIDDNVTFQELTAWGYSFDRLMKSRSGQRCFAEFLKSEYSDENILFWQACDELKRERNADKIEEKARIIYEDFVSILSPKEVSLDSRVRELINQHMVAPTAHAFDEAQQQVYTLMQRDSYPRFVASSLYQQVLQKVEVHEQESGGGSTAAGATATAASSSQLRHEIEPAPTRG